MINKYVIPQTGDKNGESPGADTVRSSRYDLAGVGGGLLPFNLMKSTKIMACLPGCCAGIVPLTTAYETTRAVRACVREGKF